MKAWIESLHLTIIPGRTRKASYEVLFTCTGLTLQVERLCRHQRHLHTNDECSFPSNAVVKLPSNLTGLELTGAGGELRFQLVQDMDIAIPQGGGEGQGSSASRRSTTAWSFVSLPWAWAMVAYLRRGRFGYWKSREDMTHESP